MDEEKERKIHQPEYIILDNHEEKTKTESEPKMGYGEVLGSIGKQHFSIGMRLLVFLTAIFVGIACALAAFFALLGTLISGLMLFRNKEINDNMKSSWKNVRKLLVITIGMLIGTFSPFLGLGMIVLYLQMQGEDPNKQFFSRIIRN